MLQRWFSIDIKGDFTKLLIILQSPFFYSEIEIAKIVGIADNFIINRISDGDKKERIPCSEIRAGLLSPDVSIGQPGYYLLLAFRF